VLEKNNLKTYLVVSLIISLAFPVAIRTNPYATAQTSPMSVHQYDKLKNCTPNLSKHPNSIEYLTNFNCGHISEGNGTTLRDFTLIIEENQKIPVSNEGHIFNGWTFNGTIPGPTMRVTEGDHVRIKVINSPGNQHAHSLHLHSIHAAIMDGVSMGGYEGGAIPQEVALCMFIAKPYGVFPYHCHVEPIADHINRGLYGMLIIDPKTPRPQMTEFAMLMNGYDLNFDQEGPVTIPTAQESNNDQQISKAVLLKDHQQPQDKGDILKNKKLKQTPPNADNQDVPANVDDV